MPSTEAPSLIAWWGAGLSTLLAIVKLWELWRDRFRLEVGYNFAGNAEVGNTILIRNLSGKPIILSFWEVLYVSGYWPRRKFEDIAYPDHDSGDRRIESHSTLELHFAEQDYFSWGHKALKGRKIFIRLHFAGRKPILKKVYP
ncbi:MAG: hypothetical protein LWW83_11270 [Azonexaceae bacterium]|nr:hypothetical protein [Azonexaceae bacterium]